MNCSTCGNVLLPDARFCPRCGSQTFSQPQPGPIYPQTPTGSSLQSRFTKHPGFRCSLARLCRLARLLGFIRRPDSSRAFWQSLWQLGFQPRLEPLRFHVACESVAHSFVLAPDQRLLHPSNRVCSSDAPAVGSHTCDRLRHPGPDSPSTRYCPWNLHAVGTGARCQRRRVCGHCLCAAWIVKLRLHVTGVTNPSAG